MFRLIGFLVVALLAVPAYAGHGCFSGGSTYGGCGPTYYGESAYGQTYSACGQTYFSGGRYVVRNYSFGYGPVYGYGCGEMVQNDCGSSSGSGSTVQKVEQKESVLPPDYYKEEKMTPLQQPNSAEPEPTEAKPEPPAESFQATSYHQTSYKPTIPVRKGDAVIVLHVSPTAKVWINGHLTRVSGTERRYISKDLIEGLKYTYNIVVDDNGQRGKGVAVLTAGQTKVMR